MFIIDLLFALVIAVVLTSIFGTALLKASWGSFLVAFFLILLFGTWAIGIWITPFGPVLWGGYWLTFLIIGLFIAVLLAAFTPPLNSINKETNIEEGNNVEEVRWSALNIYFWILIIGLFIMILSWYI
jgi:uncharacterized membrane protein YiaA